MILVFGKGVSIRVPAFLDSRLVVMKPPLPHPDPGLAHVVIQIAVDVFIGLPENPD
jgi:hypothetical protein